MNQFKRANARGKMPNYALFDAPTDQQIAKFQSDESRYYFSAAAPAVLHQAGVRLDYGPVIHPRGVFAQGGLVEGPFSQATIEHFGLVVELVEADELNLAPGSEGATPDRRLAYPRFSIREVPDASNTYGPIREFSAAKPNEGFKPVRFHVFEEVPSGFVPLLTAQVGPDEKVVAVIRDNTALIGFPFLDIAAAELSFPALDVAYFERLNDCDANLLGQFIGSVWQQLGGTISPLWPNACKGAFTIRHDYDRLITDRSLTDLLDAYDRFGVKCTWYTLARRAPSRQLRMIAEAGHEISLHSEAKSFEEFQAEIDHLASKGFDIQGFSAHGGGGSYGFVGDTQFAWCERAGLSYSEILGRRTRRPGFVVHTRNGTPMPSPLLCLPSHYSLDYEISEEEILNRLRRQMEGGHATVMNHPDIYRAKLYRVLEAVDLSSIWCATHAEVANWVRGTN